ncbi:hypothetical protein JXL19_08265, partial [bacterium]|nr:hypothetical protein [bacterium]
KDLPEYVNTLHYFSLGYGYWIKMNKDGYLVMQGQPATADISLNLKTGWSLMGFIPPDICYAKDPNAQAQICPYKIGIYQQAEGIAFCPVDPFPQTPLASISGKYQRITSFDTCDGAKLYDKDLPDFVNTLDYIGPKYGYWIKMLEDGKQVYPDECPESPPLVSISDYYTWTPGEIRVYHGTWDTDDIWIEICGNQFNTMVDGNTRLVYPIEKYQLNNEQTSAYIVFTAYEYADEQSWILWKEISAGSGNEFIQNYALFDHNMAIGDTTSSGSELLEVSERVFPELSAGSLEYVKFKVPPPEGYEELWGVNFWIVYFVKGYGEYVLQPDETDFSIVQRYLIYSTSGVGNKPDWFDNIFN